MTLMSLISLTTTTTSKLCNCILISISWTVQFFLKTESELNFGFPHIPIKYLCAIFQLAKVLTNEKNYFSEISVTCLVNVKMLLETVFSQPSIYIDGWLYAMRMTSVVCNVPVLSQNDSTYHHSVFTT